MILRRNERSARRDIHDSTQKLATAPTSSHHYYHRIMDNTSAANADKKASAASSFSPTKWVAGLLGRQAPVAAATGPTEATANDAEDYVPITAAAASISAAAAARTTTAATATLPPPPVLIRVS